MSKIKWVKIDGEFIKMVKVYGGFVAFILSWVINHSIWWGIFHFFCSCYYIIYWILKYSSLEDFIKNKLM